MYRAQVNVYAASTSALERPDMNFTITISDPSQAASEAKRIFDERYGPDLVVRTCNLRARDSVVLYFKAASPRTEAAATSAPDNGEGGRPRPLPKPVRR